MKVIKIELFPESHVKLIYEDGTGSTRKARGILMKPDLIKASLEGIKTETRRVIKPQPYQNEYEPRMLHICRNGISRTITKNYFLDKCKYGKPGDLFYIRETFYEYGNWDEGYCSDGNNDWRGSEKYKYLEDKEDMCFLEDYPGAPVWRKKPGIHMPRKAARYWFEITNIRVERLQDITEEGALKDGGWKYSNCPYHKAPEKSFRYLWDSINKKRGYAWETNPWVWVITYKKIFEGVGYGK